MYITDPKTSFMCAFESSKGNASSLRELADGNSRYTYFEAIREVADPTELRHQSGSKALVDTDYLIAAPLHNPYSLSQMRLDALKNEIDKAQKEQAKTQAIDEKKAEFVRGLLGF